MWLKWKVVSVYLGIVLISAPDRCTVRKESTMGIEIALGTPPDTPRYCMSSGSLFLYV
jgi:hypothetical protein